VQSFGFVLLQSGKHGELPKNCQIVGGKDEDGWRRMMGIM
jgi:hypothetical protein